MGDLVFDLYEGFISRIVEVLFMGGATEIGSLIGKQAQIFPTETCDLKCSGCPYPNQTEDKKTTLRGSELAPARWNEITNHLYDEGNRLFCVMGGEPASYNGVDQVIANITTHPDAFVLLSTSGIHLLHREELREAVGNALVQPENRVFKNGIAISFDGIPSSEKASVKNSRELKAQQGLDFVALMQREFPNQISYVANVMVNPDNLSNVPEIQTYLEERGIHTNLCTQQGKCFGKQDAVFDATYVSRLNEIGAEMITRKMNGGLVVNSASYLSQLPQVIGMEDYHCWEEAEGNPVIDVGPDGKLRYCNWIGQEQVGGPPGERAQGLIDGTVTWDEFWSQSKSRTAMLCRGCSWSRRDRGLTQMVEFNTDILKSASLPLFNPGDPKLQNIWVQAQLSVK